MASGINKSSAIVSLEIPPVVSLMEASRDRLLDDGSFAKLDAEAEIFDEEPVEANDGTTQS